VGNRWLSTPSSAFTGSGAAPGCPRQRRRKGRFGWDATLPPSHSDRSRDQRVSYWLGTIALVAWATASLRLALGRDARHYSADFLLIEADEL
jgi:hypothetical protein